MLRPVGKLLSLLGILLVASCAAPSRYAEEQKQVERHRQMEILDRIQQLEADLRQLRGDLERVEHRQTRAVRRDSRFDEFDGPDPDERPYPRPQVGIELDSQTPAGNNRFADPTLDDNRLATEQAPDVVDGSVEKARYDAAVTALRAGNYLRAAGEFDQFLESFPNSELAPDALYWLGEARYTSREYHSAKRALLILGAQYPSSAKIPDALLKLGFIYDQLGDKARSQEMLGKLLETFPNTNAASQARVLLDNNQ